MYAGLDIGSSLTKIVRETPDGRGLTYDRDPFSLAGGSGMSDQALAELAKALADSGLTAVGLTGTGAVRFSRAAAQAGGPRVVLGEPSSLVSHEIELQAAGVRRLLRAQGQAAKQFMLVAIGTGTSFSLVGQDDPVRQYMPGLALGGRFMAALAALGGVEISQLDELSRRGSDSDLLMRHLDPTAKFPTGELVVASMGRLGQDDLPATPANVAAASVKTVATAVAGHLMSIQANPDWKWRGPTVFIGTPVEKCQAMRDWLQLFCLGLKLKAAFPDRGSFAGALGAYQLACQADGRTGHVEPSAGLLRRCGNEAERLAGMAKLVVKQARQARKGDKDQGK